MDGSQLYARGTRLLRAELDVLKARESGDPFIVNLRNTQARLRQLNSIQLDSKSERVFNADGEILVHAKPVAPKKALIVALAVVLGLICGIAVAFAAEFLVKASEGASVRRLRNRTSLTKTVAVD